RQLQGPLRQIHRPPELPRSKLWDRRSWQTPPARRQALRPAPARPHAGSGGARGLVTEGPRCRGAAPRLVPPAPQKRLPLALRAKSKAEALERNGVFSSTSVVPTSSALGPAGRGTVARQNRGIRRQRSAAPDREGDTERQREQMELEAFTLLGAEPIHEEAELCVSRHDGAEHDG